MRRKNTHSAKAIFFLVSVSLLLSGCPLERLFVDRFDSDVCRAWQLADARMGFAKAAFVEVGANQEQADYIAEHVSRAVFDVCFIQPRNLDEFESVKPLATAGAVINSVAGDFGSSLGYEDSSGLPIFIDFLTAGLNEYERRCGAKSLDQALRLSRKDFSDYLRQERAGLCNITDTEAVEVLAANTWTFKGIGIDENEKVAAVSCMRKFANAYHGQQCDDMMAGTLKDSEGDPVPPEDAPPEDDPLPDRDEQKRHKHNVAATIITVVAVAAGSVLTGGAAIVVGVATGVAALWVTWTAPDDCIAFRPAAGVVAPYGLSRTIGAGYTYKSPPNSLDAFRQCACDLANVGSINSCPSEDDQKRLACLSNPFGPDDAPRPECFTMLKDDLDLVSGNNLACSMMRCQGDDLRLGLLGTSSCACTRPSLVTERLPNGPACATITCAEDEQCVCSAGDICSCVELGSPLQSSGPIEFDPRLIPSNPTRRTPWPPLPDLN